MTRPREIPPRADVRFRSFLSASIACASLVFSGSAWADKVAVLPFSASTSAATKADLERARVSTKEAAVQHGHKLPTDSEMLTAEMAVKDSVADTSDEYRAAGRASSSDWTVSARVDPHAVHYHLELEACQVSTGRVESLAREIDPQQATTQIGEMLAILIRPEGIANADIPWEHAAPPPPPAPRPPPPPPKLPPPPPPPKPPEPPAVRHAYAESHPIALGIEGGGYTAFGRPSNARGPRGSANIGAVLGYAIDTVPGLELRGEVAGAVAGPTAVFFDLGARYALMLVPTARIYAGPELGLGGFFPVGGDKSARFLGRGSAFAGIGIGERLQLEAYGDLAWAPGGSGTIVLGGVGARAVVRF